MMPCKLIIFIHFSSMIAELFPAMRQRCQQSQSLPNSREYVGSAELAFDLFLSPYRFFSQSAHSQSARFYHRLREKLPVDFHCEFLETEKCRFRECISTWWSAIKELAESSWNSDRMLFQEQPKTSAFSALERGALDTRGRAFPGLFLSLCARFDIYDFGTQSSNLNPGRRLH